MQFAWTSCQNTRFVCDHDQNNISIWSRELMAEFCKNHFSGWSIPRGDQQKWASRLHRICDYDEGHIFHLIQTIWEEGTDSKNDWKRDDHWWRKEGKLAVDVRLIYTHSQSMRRKERNLLEETATTKGWESYFVQRKNEKQLVSTALSHKTRSSFRRIRLPFVGFFPFNR